MKLKELFYRRGYPYDTAGELSSLEVEVGTENILKIRRIPAEKKLRAKIEEVTLEHLRKEGLLKCL